jgi:hypothetical protein
LQNLQGWIVARLCATVCSFAKYLQRARLMVLP